MLQRALGLLGDIDLALFQPLDQVVGREVDQLDGVGAIEHLVRHGLAHPHMRDLRDHVVEAFDVLDVDGGVDVDPMGQQFLDVEIAFGMTAAWGVGMGEFVDKGDLRPPRDQRVEVHLVERLILVGEPPPRQYFEALQKRFGFSPAMGLDHTNDDIRAGLLPGMGALQHLVGLADARRGADEDLELAGTAFLAPGRFQKGFRRGALFRIAAGLDHAAI